MREPCTTRLGPLLLAGALAGCPSFPGDLCGDLPGVCGKGDASLDSPVDGGFDAPPGCDLTKDPKDSPPCVADQVGVFVAPTGNDTNPGTMKLPVVTLSGAIGKLGNKPRVYVCEGAYTDSATVTVPVAIYGGLRCDWSAGGARPRITGAKPDFVVKIEGVGGAVRLVDLELAGADAQAKGGSSIAAFVNASANVTFVRVALAGGLPQPGVDGTRTDFTYPSTSDLQGKTAMSPTQGGAATTYQCPGGSTTTGGKGGDNGQDGQTGLPGPDNKGTLISSCAVSGTGGNGQNAMAGPAAAGAMKLGVLSAMGWTPEPGGNGAAGEPGQGGGGGAGASTPMGAGGGGGAGGCGGAGGGAGGGGGASLALVSLNSGVTLADCSLSARDGARGGNGIAGQAGQSPGGANGNPTPDGCRGGTGGGGGAGGAGGGGAGGVSAGVVYRGLPPAREGATQISFGARGQKGMGGAGNDGVDGDAQALFEAL